MPPSLPSLPLAGGCACGAVRYRLLEAPLELHACHCTDCQRLSGGPFQLSMVVRRSALELVQGETVRDEFKNSEGVVKRNRRCPGCASRLWGEPSRYPDFLNLRPSTLDDITWFQPTAHIWTASAQPWVTIPDATLRVERQPEDPRELVRAWRERYAANIAR